MGLPLFVSYCEEKEDEREDDTSTTVTAVRVKNEKQLRNRFDRTS